MNLSQRQKQFAITSTAGVLLFGVILLLLNGLSNWVYLRWDLTRSRAYSLSASSKKLVRSLEEPVVIKAFISTDLPVPYNTYARYVKDLLTEYRAASRGRVRFEFVPTQPAQEFEQRAMEAGLAPLQFEEMASDKLQIRRGFMGLILFYRDRSEALPVIKSLDNLEYDLTSRLARMARKDRKQILSIGGHGEQAWRGSQLKVAQDLPAFYDLDRTATLTPATTTAIEADAFLLVGPQYKYDEKDLWTIDQAIMRGTPAAFLVDSKRLMLEQFMVTPAATGVEDLLKTYGVKLGDQLVYDAQCETVGMTQNLGGMSFTTSIRFPFVPLVTQFEKKHSILRGIESVALPFPSRLDPVSPPAEGVTFTPLLFSSERSWLAPANTYSVAPNSVPAPKPDDPHGPYILGGVLEGTFPSHFAGKPSPIKGQETISKSAKNTIFVLSTSHILNPALPEFRGVDALVTNALAYLSKDDTLIGIQSKGNILRPLKPVPGAVKDILKFICILGVPILPAIWGLVRWRRRTAWRKTIVSDFRIQKDTP
jgi:gliding-associated putative ABC transporter substrate-binding component GldG